MAEEKTEKPAVRANAIVRHKMRFKHKFMLITFSLLMMALLRTGFVFLIIGMLPCIVAYYMDVSKYRYTFQSVFAANLSSMMPYITRIVHNGPSSTMLSEIMGNGLTWFIIYGSAIMGWILVKACPIFAHVMVQGMHNTQFMRFDWLQKKLEGEWGPEVKQFSGGEENQQEG